MSDGAYVIDVIYDMHGAITYTYVCLSIWVSKVYDIGTTQSQLVQTILFLANNYESMKIMHTSNYQWLGGAKRTIKSENRDVVITVDCVAVYSCITNQKLSVCAHHHKKMMNSE